MSGKSQKARTKRQGQRIKIDGKLVHPDAPHGQIGGYSYYGCRCEPCTKAGSEARLGQYQRKTGATTPARPKSIHDQLDDWAESTPNRTPLQPDPHLYALLHEEEMAS